MSAYLSLGTILRNRWQIGRELGRGGYSVVYLARDREIGCDVALKLLVPPPAAAELARERMRREVQAVRGISHENIVAVYDFVEEGPWSFILMEYVAGPDLQVRVRERGPLVPDQAVRLGRDIAAALGTAHRHGILHRDVKPQNVLLDPDGRFRLTDFGSARLDGQMGMTTTGAVAGTPDYTAPEVTAGRRGDARADLYALGLTLYFGLTGELPTREAAAPAGIAGHRPKAVTPAVPEWLDDIVARATAVSAEDRFPTAAALDQALSRSMAEAPSPAQRCVLCGGPDPLHLGLCPGCGGDGAAAESLVFLERAAGRAARAKAETRLVAVLPSVGADVVAAVRGDRPLFRASAEGAHRIVDALERRELAARAVPARSVMAVLPGGFWLMLAAVVIAGTMAAVAAAPVLGWVTPVFAGLLVVSARRSAATPLISPRSHPTGLPSEIERRLLATLAELPAGTARDLLADLTRMGDGLFTRLVRNGDRHGSGGAVLGELLVACCSAASDVALLDANLGRFERQRERLALRSGGSMDALGRCERTRDGLVQRLLEAMTVLGQLQSQTADFDAGESGLTDSIAEIRAESAARAAAAEEIAALLGGTGERGNGASE